MIQDPFIGEHLGAFSHLAFIHDVVNVMDDRIRGDFPFGEPMEGLHLFGKTVWQAESNGRKQIDVTTCLG